MKALRNSRGIVFGGILIVVATGMVFGASFLKAHQCWDKAKPPVKKVHYYFAEDVQWAPDRVIFDFSVPMPDEKK